MTSDEVGCLLDRARARAETARLRVESSARRSGADDIWVSDATATSLKFLFRLLWHMGAPLVILGMLESELDAKFVALQSVIDSDKTIASELRREEEGVREALDELKGAQNFIQHQKAAPAPKARIQPSRSGVQLQQGVQPPKEGGRGGEEDAEQERGAAGEAEAIQRRGKEYHARLDEQDPRLEPCERLQQAVGRLEAELAQ